MELVSGDVGKFMGNSVFVFSGQIGRKDQVLGKEREPK